MEEEMVGEVHEAAELRGGAPRVLFRRTAPSLAAQSSAAARESAAESVPGAGAAPSRSRSPRRTGATEQSVAPTLAPPREALVSLGGVALDALGALSLGPESPWFCLDALLEHAQDVLVSSSRAKDLDIDCLEFMVAVATEYGCFVQALRPCFSEVRQYLRLQQFLMRRG